MVNKILGTAVACFLVSCQATAAEELITINSGTNLISTTISSSDGTNLNMLNDPMTGFQGRVLTFDAETQSWKQYDFQRNVGELFFIEPYRGYWFINNGGNTQYTFQGDTSQADIYGLHEGWNLISSSLDNSTTTLASRIADANSGLTLDSDIVYQSGEWTVYSDSVTVDAETPRWVYLSASSESETTTDSVFTESLLTSGTMYVYNLSAYKGDYVFNTDNSWSADFYNPSGAASGEDSGTYSINGDGELELMHGSTLFETWTMTGQVGDCYLATVPHQIVMCTTESARDASYPNVPTAGGETQYPTTGLSKISSSGALLEDSATEWSCVRDNETGLTWEVKTDDGGIHDKDNTYRWGGAAEESLGGDNYGDWDVLVNGSNSEQLCGYSDWRVPTRDELQGIVVTDAGTPTIDTNYFPNTPVAWFWSSSPDASDSNNAWVFGFDDGGDGNGYRGSNYRVRLVRGGQ